LEGCNYFPEDIEALARDVPGVFRGHCVAVPTTGPDQEERVALLAEGPVDAAEADALADVLRGRISDALGLPRVDVRIVPPKSLPRTTSGKWQRGLAGDLLTNGAPPRHRPRGTSHRCLDSPTDRPEEHPS